MPRPFLRTMPIGMVHCCPRSFFVDARLHHLNTYHHALFAWGKLELWIFCLCMSICLLIQISTS